MREIRLTKILRIGGLIVLFGLIIGFTYFKTRDLLFGLRLEVTGIVDKANYPEGVLEIIGKARKAEDLTINGDKIFVDQEGKFRDWRILSPGYNMVTIKTTDRFGKERTKNFEVTFNK